MRAWQITFRVTKARRLMRSFQRQELCQFCAVLKVSRLQRLSRHRRAMLAPCSAPSRVALAPSLGGCAALDGACARFTPALIDGVDGRRRETYRKRPRISDGTQRGHALWTDSAKVSISSGANCGANDTPHAAGPGVGPGELTLS